MKKVFFQIHKITGSLMSLLFLIWFTSGIVLIFQGYPHASRKERFMHLEKFSSKDFDNLKAPTATFKGRIELEKHLGKPVYRVYTGKKSQKIYDASTLKPLPPFNQIQATQIAFSFLKRPVKNIEVIKELDLWTPWSSYKTLLPFYKCEMDDDVQTVLYISKKTGTIIQQTNRKSRWAAYLGAIPHWIYFKSLRNNKGTWKIVIVALSSIGIIVCFSGIIAGFYRFRRKKLTPYKKFHYKWHHLTGLLFGVFAFTFVLSGLISVTGVPDALDGNEKEKITWNTKSILKEFANTTPSQIWESIDRPNETRKIVWKNIFSTPHIFVYSNNYEVPKVYTSNKIIKPLQGYSIETIKQIAAEKIQKKAYKVTYQDKFDNYYQPSGMLYTPLPVYKIAINDDASTWLYINPKTGEEIKRFTTKSRVRRWLYRAFHCFNIQFLKQNNWLRISLLIFVSLMGITISFTGLVLSKRWIYKIFTILLIVNLCSCNQQKKSNSKTVNGFSKIKLNYAKELTIEKKDDVTKLTVFTSNKDRNLSETYHLVKDDALLNKFDNSLKVPCKKIICLSSTQLAYFFELDNIENIAAINNSRYLFHEEMRAKVDAGEVKRIGKEGNFNLEVIAAINPDIIFVSPFKRGGFDALRNLGIPLVPMAAYNENTPLGRAEWIKMISLFIGEEQKADSVFNAIDKRYASFKNLTANVKYRPTVFSGKMRSGSWYVPGGKSFYSHYFKDAGADYIIKDDHQGAYPVDFETMYKKANQCDFWRIVHPEKKGLTLNDLAEQDSRYKDFKAFSDKNVLLCNIRQKPYYEQAAVKPDILLADYIHFFHPELLPEHIPYFYEKLE